MVSHHVEHSLRWKRPTLKNAKSFLIRLINSQAESSVKGDETPKNKPSSKGRNSLPPAYDIAIQSSPFAIDSTTDSVDHSEEGWNRSRPARPKCMDNATRAHPSLSPLRQIQLRGRSLELLQVSPNSPVNEQHNQPRSTAGGITLPSISSRHSPIGTHPDGPNLTEPGTTCKISEASSNHPALRRYYSERRLNRSHRSGNHIRDRELIAAKKSLPILTKYGQTTHNKNVSLC